MFVCLFVYSILMQISVVLYLEMLIIVTMFRLEMCRRRASLLVKWYLRILQSGPGFKGECVSDSQSP